MIPAALTGLSIKQWLQLGIAVVLLVLLVWAGIAVSHWRNEAAKVPGLKQEIKEYAAQIEQLKADVTASNAASAGYQAELARLRAARTTGPTPVVRVCKPAKVPASGPTQPGSDEGSADGGLLPQEPGPDIGPALYGDADLADEVSAQVRGLQTYINTVCLAK